MMHPAAICADSQSSGLVHRLNEAELRVLGQTHREQPLEKRISTLEKQTLGHEQPGSAHKRLSAIEQVIGHAQHSDLLPPEAPKLDIGQAAEPSVAPQFERPTFLRANATEYGAFRNPLYGNNNAGAYAPMPTGMQMGSPLDIPLRATNGVSENPGMQAQAASANASSLNRRAAILSTITTAGRCLPGPAGIMMGQLHCPLCRLLSH